MKASTSSHSAAPLALHHQQPHLGKRLRIVIRTHSRSCATSSWLERWRRNLVQQLHGQQGQTELHQKGHEDPTCDEWSSVVQRTAWSGRTRNCASTGPRKLTVEEAIALASRRWRLLVSVKRTATQRKTRKRISDRGSDKAQHHRNEKSVCACASKVNEIKGK